MMNNEKIWWYNYRTKEYDEIPPPTDYEDYLPQDGASQNMYNLLWTKMGRSKIEACNEVLSVHIKATENQVGKYEYQFDDWY